MAGGPVSDQHRVRVREAIEPAEIAAAKALFEEYADSLGIDLEFQGFGQELAGLPGAYSRPGGILWLATTGSRPAGCVAVRRLDGERCEMKRLFVRDEARGRGVGRALAEAAIDFSKAAGYRTMLLDTLPSMATAQGLYRQLGFRETPPYRYNPVPGTAFMELTLEGSPGQGPQSRVPGDS